MAFNMRKFMPSLPSVPAILGGAISDAPAPSSFSDNPITEDAIDREDDKSHTDDKAHAELSTLVDRIVGAVGQPSALAAASIENDKLTAGLHASFTARSRLLSQFLRARQGSAREAARMLANALIWRRQVSTERYLKEHRQLMNHKSANFPMAILSNAKHCKQPVVYGLIRLMDKRKIERGPFADACIAFFEALYFAVEYAQDEMVVILDFRGWSLRKHAPFRAVKDGINTLQTYYPERLGRVFLVNYPPTIRAAYTAITPVIDSGAREKIVWVPDNPFDTLSKYISPKSIPTFMDGELEADFPMHWPNISAEWANPDIVSLPSW